MQALLDAFDRALMAIAITALLLMTLVCVVSVGGRYLFNAPIPDDLTISEMLIVVLVFLPFARVQALRDHVAVNLLTDRMSPRAQEICWLLGLAVGIVLFTVLTAATFSDFYGALAVGAYVSGRLELPEWPARFAVFLGCAALLLRLVLDAAVSLRRLRQP